MKKWIQIMLISLLTMPYAAFSQTNDTISIDLLKETQTINIALSKGQDNYATVSPGLDVIGFGYDVFGSYANMKSKKPYCLFNWANYETTYIGSNTYKVPQYVLLENISEHPIEKIESFSMRSSLKKIAVKVGLKADASFFGGSSASFSKSKTTTSNTKQFFYKIMDINTKWRISLDTRDISTLKNILAPQFKVDIDTMNAQRLFDNYGTHFIARAYIGGRIDFNSVSHYTKATEISKIKAKVETKVQSVTISAAAQQNNQTQDVDSNTEIYIMATGGNSQFVSQNMTNKQYKSWADGIESRPVLCDFDKKSLKPIWIFATNKERQNELKDVYDALLLENPLPKTGTFPIKITDMEEVYKSSWPAGWGLVRFLDCAQEPFVFHYKQAGPLNGRIRNIIDATNDYEQNWSSGYSSYASFEFNGRYFHIVSKENGPIICDEYNLTKDGSSNSVDIKNEKNTKWRWHSTPKFTNLEVFKRGNSPYLLTYNKSTGRTTIHQVLTSAKNKEKEYEVKKFVIDTLINTNISEIHSFKISNRNYLFILSDSGEGRILQVLINESGEPYALEETWYSNSFSWLKEATHSLIINYENTNFLFLYEKSKGKYYVYEVLHDNLIMITPKSLALENNIDSFDSFYSKETGETYFLSYKAGDFIRINKLD